VILDPAEIEAVELICFPDAAYDSEFVATAFEHRADAICKLGRFSIGVVIMPNRDNRSYAGGSVGLQTMNGQDLTILEKVALDGGKRAAIHYSPLDNAVRISKATLECGFNRGAILRLASEPDRDAGICRKQRNRPPVRTARAALHKNRLYVLAPTLSRLAQPIFVSANIIDLGINRCHYMRLYLRQSACAERNTED
jgi:hypothetical protein